jgi:hypothetical protein
MAILIPNSSINLSNSATTNNQSTSLSTQIVQSGLSISNNSPSGKITRGPSSILGC